MKNRLSVFALLCFAVFAGAAPLSAQGLRIGGEGGVNLADLGLEPDDGLETDTRVGILLGGILGYEFGPEGVFGVRTGAYYAQKGATLAVTGTTDEVDFELDYLEVPLLLTAKVPTRGSPVQPRAYAGGVAGFELSCTASGSIDGVTVDADCDAPALGENAVDTKSVDFGLLFGAGVDIAAGPGALTLDGRYALGLTDINDTEVDDTEVKNRALGFTAGYSVSVP